MKPKTNSCALLSVAAILAAGCASSQPSSHLQNARSEYSEAKNSQATQLVPVKVHEAKQALDEAERAHADDPRSYEEKSLAYVAYRKAELAMSASREAQARNAISGADAMYEAKQAQLLQQANQKAETREQQLERERQAKLEAQQRASEAMASLQELAKVKEEAQRTIITLDGAVLFETNKSTLLPLAQDKLKTVAESLKEMDTDSQIVVLGHTDSRGSDSHNLDLSRARAEAVSGFLGSHGIEAQRISAEGRGEAQPIASNDTPEGRANNRRVEIIIQHGDDQHALVQ
jgi:outer membrane protein OmpA-like peptidoglycan-associated protein